jgi:ATP-dependent protease ClpP protease subunit
MPDENNKPILAEYRVTFAGDICAPMAAKFRSFIVSALQQPDFGALTILFSSEGGSTDESLSLFNFISSLPTQVHMHSVGHVGSAAVPVFLAGHVRTCVPLSRFFFHEYDWGFDGRQTLHRIEEAVQRLRSDVELARNILKARTKATEQILGALDGTSEPAILTPEQAQALGFVDEVCDLAQIGRNGMTVCVANVT